MRGITSILFLIFGCLNYITAQIEPEYREAFIEGESYFLFEEYADALVYYQLLNEVYPDNDNINYKTGVCLLNDPYRKEEAIIFLEKAVLNINPKCKDDSYKETTAPPEAYFYLGDAYRINNQLEKAIETYEKFKKIGDSETYDFDLVDDQITACTNALELMKKPLDMNITNVGDRINSNYSDINPVVSGDQSRMVYIQKQAFYDALFFSEKKNGVWSYPRNIMFELAVDEDAYPTGLSYDGTVMLIYRSDNFIGDIYTSRYVNNQWTPLVKLNEYINTKYWESHACFTRDGKTLYFTSNRKGSYGGLDIYYSRMDENKKDWGPPVNLGRTINTKYNEETPFITLDGRTLFFSSYGHYNTGGYDVYYSTLLEDNKWSAPVNIGYPVNTTDDDIFFQPLQDMHHAYFPRFRDDGLGRRDIYLVEIFSDAHPRKFMINGIAGIQNLKILTTPVHVSLVEKSGGDTLTTTRADSSSGRFSIEAVKGSYDLVIRGDEIQPVIRSLTIPDGYTEADFNVEPEILLFQKESILLLFEPKIVDRIETSDTLITVNTGDTLLIALGLDEKATLVAGTYHDSMLLRTDTFSIDSAQFNLYTVPMPGENMVALKMIDTAGNLSYKNIRVVYTPLLAENVTSLSGQDITETIPPSDHPVTPRQADPGLEELIADLSQATDGTLKETLLKLDVEGEGITNSHDLISYLKDNSDRFGYASQEVHDIVLKGIQVKYLDEYISQLTDLTDDADLKKALGGINLYGNEITSLADIYHHLVNASDTGGYQVEHVNAVFSLLSQRVEVESIIEELSTGGQTGLAEAVKDIDLEKSGIRNTVELFTYLFNKAGKYDYTEADVVAVMLNLLEKQDLRQMIASLQKNAPEELYVILNNLDPEKEHIADLASLSDYLVSKATETGIKVTEVYQLFLQMYDQIEVEKIIEEIEITEVTRPARDLGYIYWTSGAALLVILLIIIYRRRR